MILLDNLHLCIVTPPKTGSTSLQFTFCRAPYTGMAVIGPQLDGLVEKHTADLPWRVTEHNYKVAIVTRDPQERALSLWRHAQRFGIADYLPNFNNFLQTKLITGTYKFGKPLGSVYGHLRFDKILRLERIGPDLRTLDVPITQPIRIMNENPGPTPPINAALMAQWIALDTNLKLKV